MQTNALKQEKRYLKISALGNILVGCIGIAVAAVDILFTADRRWGAPLSDGGFGGPATSA